MFPSALAIAAGASAGALLRWQLSLRLNVAGAAISAGTLLANAVGAYIVGLAIGFLGSSGASGDTWRLLIITGFCGGLTTFSTFSVEVVTLLQAGRFQAAALSVFAHVAVSLLLTWAGLSTWSLLKPA